jgi:hypothetical protein
LFFACPFCEENKYKIDKKKNEQERKNNRLRAHCTYYLFTGRRVERALSGGQKVEFKNSKNPLKKSFHQKITLKGQNIEIAVLSICKKKMKMMKN